MQLNDPLQNSVPTVGGVLPPATGKRFTPAPLSHTAMAFLQWSLERNQLRRSVYRARHLRVYIDGEAYMLLDLEGDAYDLFRVPLSASYIEIFGDDDKGALLLAVFPLPEPALVEDDQPQHLAVTLEGGQTVAIEIALSDGTRRRRPGYVIRLSYAESAEVQTLGAENLAVEARPALPPSETATLRSPRISAGEKPAHEHAKAEHQREIATPPHQD
jgi:hypothetical protein